MQPALIAIHLLIAIGILATAAIKLGSGAQRVSDIRHVADGEHATKERMEKEHARLQGLLEGVRRQDPYVIEMIARDRLDYHRPGELSPPPLARP